MSDLRYIQPKPLRCAVCDSGATSSEMLVPIERKRYGKGPYDLLEGVDFVPGYRVTCETCGATLTTIGESEPG